MYEQVHYLLKRSYKRQKEERCSRVRHRSHSRSLPGLGEGAVMRELGNRTSGTGETGRSWRRSIFLGRSTAGSTTHFSSADASPNPLQKQINLTVMPVLPAQPQKLSTIPSEEPSSVSDSVNGGGCPAAIRDAREPLLIRETCLENWKIFILCPSSLDSYLLLSSKKKIIFLSYDLKSFLQLNVIKKFIFTLSLYIRRVYSNRFFSLSSTYGNNLSSLSTIFQSRCGKKGWYFHTLQITSICAAFILFI